jgi:adenylate kinase
MDTTFCTSDVGPKPDRAAWLAGPGSKCDVEPAKRNRAWRIVLLGAPGVGKGTQAQLLGGELGACHLSTGDIFRAAKAVASDGGGGAGAAAGAISPAMEDALGYMKRGDLVPDAIVLAILRERVPCLQCHGGFLLDGFPRTVPQAQALSDLLDGVGVKLDAVIDYQMPIDQIVSRLSGRRTCAACKAVFHEQTRPPRQAGVCDACGGTLVQREDDRPEAVRVRMKAYSESTAPLAAYYAKRDLLVAVEADGSPEEILRQTLGALGVGA